MILPGRPSICKCGHTGGTVGTHHGPRYAEGHGACRVPDCDCPQFTWARFVREPA